MKKELFATFSIMLIAAALVTGCSKTNTPTADTTASIATNDTEDTHEKDEILLPIVNADGKYGYANLKGEVIIKPQFDAGIEFSTGGLARVFIDNKFGYIDKTGEIVIEAQFDRAETFDNHGLAWVMADDSWGLINEKGEFVIKPQFDWVDDFADNGLAAFSVAGKSGYINESGEIVLELDQTFADVHFNKYGLATARWGRQKDSLINENGEIIFLRATTFDYIHELPDIGLILVYTEGKIGYYNEKGEVILEPKFYE